MTTTSLEIEITDDAAVASSPSATKKAMIALIILSILSFIRFGNIQERIIDVKDDNYGQMIELKDSSRVYQYPKLFIFGHSTGHSGTGTFHTALGQPGCPWKQSVSYFEDIGEGEIEWSADPECELTRDKLVPHLLSRINISTVEEFDRDRRRYRKQQQKSTNTNSSSSSWNPTTYIDLGHFHNRGRTLECLAEYFGESSAFVHIRRNRYDIAQSFLGKMGTRNTPCIVDTQMYGKDQWKTRKDGTIVKTTLIHPQIAVCPRSGENAGPVNLKVSDDIWDNSFVPFQRFLWYADEIEHRWHTLKSNLYSDVSYDTATTKDTTTETTQGGWGRPRFYEVTWNNGAELMKEVDKLRQTFGCTELPNIAHQHSHVEHNQKSRNCSDQIRLDLEYRKLMKYEDATLRILVSSDFPQHVDHQDCLETNAELEQAIQTYTNLEGMAFNQSEWVLPAVESFLP